MLLAHAVLKDGQDVLIIGLSAQNRCLMEEFQAPIELQTRVNGAHRLRVLIFAGDTEDSMQPRLQELLAHAERTPEEVGH